VLETAVNTILANFGKRRSHRGVINDLW
jgi:hypothetical protein